MAEQDEAEPRVRYFDGQLLTVSELTDEQAFHRSRQERHARLLHAPGIARGLEVTAIPSQKEVTVAPGVAVDALGRQIILKAMERRTLQSIPGNGDLLVISFNETDDLPESKFRYIQQPTFERLQKAALDSQKHVVLARLTETGGHVSADPEPRQYAGVRLPSKGEAALTLRSGGDAAGRLALLEGALQVRAPAPISTALKVSTGEPGQEKSLLEVGSDGRIALGSKTTVDTNGFIQNDKWRATSILYQGTKTGGQGDLLKLRASFTYQGGMLVLLASGSARRMDKTKVTENGDLEEAGKVEGGNIGMTLKLNDKPVEGGCKYWVRPDVTTHYPFSTTAVIPPTTLIPGTVVLTLAGVDEFTKIDENDFFSVTVFELPISAQTRLKFSLED